MNEKWLPVHGYTSYEVSNTGKVRRTTKGHFLEAGEELQQCFCVGYMSVTLFKNGNRILVKVHQLVVRAFVGPPPADGVYMVAHLDGNKRNNHVSNLCWVTCAENLSHRARHGTEMRGERNGRCKLSADDVIEIRRRYKRRDRYDGAAALAKEYGVTDVAILKIISRVNWSHI